MRVVRTLTGLTTVGMMEAGNKICVEGATMLAEALKTNATLRTLDVGGKEGHEEVCVHEGGHKGCGVEVEEEVSFSTKQTEGGWRCEGWRTLIRRGSSW